MNKYKVDYLTNGEETSKEVEALSLLDLAIVLDTKYLYADQYSSVFNVTKLK